MLDVEVMLQVAKDRRDDAITRAVKRRLVNGARPTGARGERFGRRKVGRRRLGHRARAFARLVFALLVRRMSQAVGP